MLFLFQIGFLEINWVDILDILLVSALLYNLYKLIRGSVALNIVIGFLSIYLVYLVVKATEMELLTTILGQFMGVGVIAAIVLFQQEIKKFLILISKTTFLNEFRVRNFWDYLDPKRKRPPADFNLSSILDAMKSLSGSNTGALMVLSKQEPLTYYVETGDELDAKVSKRLLLSIFFKNSPLHDGAAIIYKGRVVAARCILPVTDNQDIPATLGLRHRAAIGLTEVSSAVVLIVSEETGQMSFVRNGQIFHNLSLLEIRKHLNEYLQSSEETEEQKAITEKEQALAQEAADAEAPNLIERAESQEEDDEPSEQKRRVQNA